VVEGTPFGRYRLLEMLGRGGMGEVWRAYDTAANNRTVAIKLLPQHLARDATFVQRFRREADAAAQLSSPHIVPIHNYGEIDGQLYVDMRLIEGRDLHDVLLEGPLQSERAVHVVGQIAKALNAAHEAGLVHRDVKPSNVLVDDDDFAYLIDFGIAHAVDDTRLTSTGNAIGTFAYMAPERLAENSVDDARVDVYALACVLYECLTGRPPFGGTSIVSLVAAHLHAPPPRPSATVPGVPRGLDDVVVTGMAKNPDDRYATTLELARAAQVAVTAPISGYEPVRVAHTSFADPRPSAPEDWSMRPPATPPGGPWWRSTTLAIVVAVVVAIAAVAWAASIVSGHEAATTSTAEPPAPANAAPSAIVEPVGVSVFSPDGQADSPELAGLAIDGDPLSAWPTDTYLSPTPFPYFKTGVGLLLQLGRPTALGLVTVDVSSTGTVVEIRSAESPTPSTLQDTVLLAPATALVPGRNDIKVDPGMQTANVLVWISTLGTTNGKSQAAVSEITLQRPS
jgi:serine/threonine protein kinase